MAEYLHPGVYIEEIGHGPRPIEGVPTSTAAIIGACERGATRPLPVNSSLDYARHFGGEFGVNQFGPAAVRGFFENGGRRLFVVRIAGRKATAAQVTLGDFTVAAAGSGSWGNRIWLKISPAPPAGMRVRLAYFAEGMTPYDCFDPSSLTDAGKPQLVEDHVVAEQLADSALAVLTRRAGSTTTSLVDFSGTLAGGVDGQVAEAEDFEHGLAALGSDECREVSLVHSPGVPGPIQAALLHHCERHRFRFAVFDLPRGGGHDDVRAILGDTSHAACYAPWLEVATPSGTNVLVPPGGHVLGVYARVDAERGVFKAPANEPLRGVSGLEYSIGQLDQQVLAQRGINAIRAFPGQGIRVWGARTPSTNGLWKYVNIRRLFIFLERSIYEGTQWVVFEPNDARLWARIKDTIRLFLRIQWLAGALMGTTEEEAFFITCDQTTMSQDDILNGRLIVEVGIAPVKPAEFVIFRIFQSTAEAQR
jgi:phage tail sheath protein FI